VDERQRRPARRARADGLSGGASAPDGNAGLAADGDTFWFANFGLGEVRIADFGQDAVTLLSGQDAPAQLAVDATHIYWTNDSAITSGDGVMRADRDDGSQVQSLAPNVDEATGIALDADSVYVTSDTRVLRVPKLGGDAEVLASSLFGPRGIVSAGDRIYWVTAGDSGGSTGTVMTVDAAGREEATVLATGQSSPVLIAADETQIFWTNLGNAPNTGSVMRLAR
jgi:hypothetical protein